MKNPLKKEPKVLSKPTGQLNTSNVSIERIMNPPKKETEELEEDYSNRPRTPFGIDELKMAWKRYAFKIKPTNMSLYTAMTRRDPKLLEDYRIHMELDNDTLKERLEREKADLLVYLRGELKNWGIQLTYNEVEQGSSSQAALYSGMDKFKKMSEKNPNLNTLQKLFNLDIDF